MFVCLTQCLPLTPSFLPISTVFIYSLGHPYQFLSVIKLSSCTSYLDIFWVLLGWGVAHFHAKCSLHWFPLIIYQYLIKCVCVCVWSLSREKLPLWDEIQFKNIQILLLYINIYPHVERSAFNNIFLISGRVKNLPSVKIAFVVFTYITFSYTSKPLSSFWICLSSFHSFILLFNERM